ncbi:MAG: hypothetical protein CFE29_01775 [Bradyrhizobiaceae bacterium PARB1]|nr:MAG: hypothetical protein CFE29_01775 [Bradyrhizobiaceae bacterium PARB1]
MSTSPALAIEPTSLYEDDFYGWIGRQVALVKAGRNDEVDLENIAEELDDLGKSIYRELENRVAGLVQHVLKWEYQPDRRARSWEATIREQRKRIAKLLNESPSLKPKLDEALREGYDYGRNRASGDTDLPIEIFPEQRPYSWEDLMEKEFSMDASPAPGPK